MGYWDKDVIPEDSRFYWKAFFTFGERFSVKSVYLPLYGDSPNSRDYASTHMSQYNQIKRWAWGITDVPYVLARLFKHPEIPLWLRIRRFMNLFLNHLNWIFLPVLLMFGASVPIWVSVDFSLTDLGQTLWSYSGILLSTTLSTVVFFLYFETLLLPPKPADWPLWKKVGRALPVLHVPDRRPRAQRASRAGGAHALAAGPLPRVSGHGEGVDRMDEAGARTIANHHVGALYRDLARQAARAGPRHGRRDAQLETPSAGQLGRRADRPHPRLGARDDPRGASTADERDRESEFRAEAEAADLLALLDRADADLDEHLAA